MAVGCSRALRCESEASTSAMISEEQSLRSSVQEELRPSPNHLEFIILQWEGFLSIQDSCQSSQEWTSQIMLGPFSAHICYNKFSDNMQLTQGVFSFPHDCMFSLFSLVFKPWMTWWLTWDSNEYLELWEEQNRRTTLLSIRAGAGEVPDSDESVWVHLLLNIEQCASESQLQVCATERLIFFVQVFFFFSPQHNGAIIFRTKTLNWTEKYYRI